MNKKSNALVIGSSGAIGKALATELKMNYEVQTISRETSDYSERSLSSHSQALRESGAYRLIICCIGSLHTDKIQPEKRLDDLNAEQLRATYQVNTILPALCLRFFHDLLDQGTPSAFVVLSAMVGSITDNRLGGWYGYRSSKAALNMIIKTASIEITRTNKQATIAAIHPGTTISPLSQPFSSRVPKGKYYTPQQSARRIIEVAETLTPDRSGAFLNWDGTQIAW